MEFRINPKWSRIWVGLRTDLSESSKPNSLKVLEVICTFHRIPILPQNIEKLIFSTAKILERSNDEFISHQSKMNKFTCY